MGNEIAESDSLYYGSYADIATREWVDYVQDMDTNTFGDSRVYVTFKGTGIIKLSGKKDSSVKRIFSNRRLVLL